MVVRGGGRHRGGGGHEGLSSGAEGEPDLPQSLSPRGNSQGCPADDQLVLAGRPWWVGSAAGRRRRLAGVDLTSASEELYAGLPEEFVARRKELARQARAAKDRPLANDFVSDEEFDRWLRQYPGLPDGNIRYVATTEYRPAGQCDAWASSRRSTSSVTATITAGSVRG